MGWSNQAEAAIPGAKTASKTIGSGGMVNLVDAADNPNGLRLWTASISSCAAGSDAELSSSFMVEDTITDSGGTQYLACQVGMGQGAGGATPNGIPQDLGGIMVPGGVDLILNNGGAGGTTALRQCSATVLYQVVS